MRLNQAQFFILSLSFGLTLFVSSPYAHSKPGQKFSQPTLRTQKKSPVQKPKTPSVPELLLQIENRYRHAKTLAAKFTQTVYEKALNQTKTSLGKLWIELPSKIRWETQEPHPQLLIQNGNVSWFYTPPYHPDDQGQWLKKKITFDESELAQTLLSGSFSLAKTMKIAQKSPTLFELTPLLSKTSRIVQATLSIEPKQQIIQSISLVHKGGNQTHIQLSQIELGQSFPNELFIFTPPKNSEEITDNF